jgi:hypothetical protein
VRSVLVIAGVLLIACTPPCAGQTLPSAPVTLANGRLTIGGEASAAIAARDQGFFNYTDYEHSALRLVRLAVTAAWQPTDRLAILGDVRTENWDELRAYALYVRVRPWRDQPFDIQAGRIPPVFGAFARRPYGPDNLLIGYPLAYQYLTSLRVDAIPAVPDDLRQMRGRGWFASYPVGSAEWGPGVPLVSAFRWDTGVQARVGGSRADASVAVTTGTLSNPRLGDDNGGRQVAGRVTVRPAVGLEVGASAARGAFLSRDATRPLSGVNADSFAQRALGFDAEYSRDHWLVRGELIRSAWNLPTVGAADGEALRALSATVEGRYRLRPGLYVAGRLDRLHFSSLHDDLGWFTWDAPVTRIEFGGGYSLLRNVVARISYQHNWRDGGRVTRQGFIAGQIVYWF